MYIESKKASNLINAKNSQKVSKLSLKEPKSSKKSWKNINMDIY